MGETTKIEWCDHTFNPWIGCSKVHTGCTHCYAESLAKRTGKAKWGDTGTRVLTSPANWRLPHKWNRDAEKAGERRRVFCASLADVFEDWKGPMLTHQGKELWEGEANLHCPQAPVGRRTTMGDCRAALFKIIDATPWLDWLLLTKRPENVRRMWPTEDDGAGGKLAEAIFGRKGRLIYKRPNVWLGTSVSDQETADKAVPELLKCSEVCDTLFLSVEPLVGPIELGHLRRDTDDAFNCLTGIGGPNVSWVIIGGESGGGARPCAVEWVRSIVRDCSPEVPVFVKQLGAFPVQGHPCHPPGGKPFYTVNNALKLKDKKGGDWNEWPEDLRVREFPTAAIANAERGA